MDNTLQRRLRNSYQPVSLKYQKQILLSFKKFSQTHGVEVRTVKRFNRTVPKFNQTVSLGVGGITVGRYSRYSQQHFKHHPYLI